MADEKKDALAIRPTTTAARFRFQPETFGQAMEMATLIAKSDLCPKAYRGKPADCLLAYEYGATLGLSWLQALRWIGVINGIPSIYGDAIPAIILGSNECERFKEWIEGDGDERVAHCIMRRKGYPDEFHKTFGVKDAKLAKLWGKTGRDGQDTPWVTYPDRMLQWRATGFTARAAFADKLSGLILAEEAMDYPETAVIDVTPTVPEDRLARVPEGLRDNLDRAFLALSLSPAQILVKVNEYLGGDGDPEEGATNLLRWCRDEFSRRKTGQPMKVKGDSNGKPKPQDSPATAAEPSGSREPRSGDGVHAEGDAADAVRHEPVQAAAVPRESASAPLTAADVGFRSQDLGF